MPLRMPCSVECILAGDGLQEHHSDGILIRFEEFTGIFEIVLAIIM